MMKLFNTKFSKKLALGELHINQTLKTQLNKYKQQQKCKNDMIICK